MSEIVDVEASGRRLRIEYEWVGDAASKRPVIVFLHEGLGSVAMWKSFPADFCRANGLRGLVYSRPGYGRSTPRDPAERWTPRFMHEQADDVLPRLLARLGVARPWLFGHSDGASIALLFAARHETAGLVVLAPHTFVEPVAVASIAKARAAYVEGDLRERLARYHDDVDSAFFGWNDVWLSDAFADWTIEAEIASIAAPILAVQGTADEYGTLDQLEAIRRRLPKTRLLVLPDVGHSPHRDRPEQVIREAGRFIAEHEADVAAPTRPVPSPS